MLPLKYLPEIAAFVLFILISTESFGGAVFVVLEFALVGLMVLVRPKAALETVVRWWPLLLIPLLDIISSLWSSVPDLSFRYGLQFLFTVFTGVFLARLMSPKRWVAVFLVSTFVFCILSILSGRQGTSDVGMVLVGLTGSKNQMSYEGQLLLMAAVTALLMGGISNPLRWIAFLAIPLGTGIVAITNSATGDLMAIGGTGVLLALWFSQRFTPGGRLASVVGGALTLAPLIFLMPEILALMDHFLYDTLNKDPTLTGRTFLWERADDLISRRPVLGYGYQSIWMGDSFETIGLKRLTGITDGRVFHFHNTFRQVAVDIGLLGLAVFVLTMLSTLLKGVMQVLLRPTVMTSFFFVIFLLSFLRAFTDTVLQPFSIHTIILFSCCVYARWRPDTAMAEDFGLARWRFTPAHARRPA